MISQGILDAEPRACAKSMESKVNHAPYIEVAHHLFCSAFSLLQSAEYTELMWHLEPQRSGPKLRIEKKTKRQPAR